MDEGQSVEELVETFGDPHTSARLIRRAKMRNRPWIWQVLRRSRQALGVAVAVYVVLLAVALTSHPDPRIDYVAQLNESAVSARTEDRAWPLYRELFIRHNIRDNARGSDYVLLDARPGDDDWPKTQTFLREREDLISGIRHAAMKPSLGLTLGFAWDFSPVDGRALFGEEWKQQTATIGKNVIVETTQGTSRGKAVDIDENGALVLETETSERRTVVYGDCFHQNE